MDANALELGWEKLRCSGRLSNWKKGPSRANLAAKVFVEICFFTYFHGELSGSFIRGHKDIERPLEVKLICRVRAL